MSLLFIATTFCCSKPAFIATRAPPEDEGALAYGYQKEGPACDKEASCFSIPRPRESDLSRERKMPEAR